MITTVIFDMDGLLIDSEPLWREAEVGLFGSLGVPIDETRCYETMGLRTDEVVNYWYARYPWNDLSESDVTHQLDTTVVDLVKKQGTTLPGAIDVLELVKKYFKHVALASSSKMILIDAVIDKFNIRENFEIVYSAENEPFGKPHPGVYISTMQKLGVAPSECLAFEDSFNGLLSAKSAKMKCVAVPDQEMRSDQRYVIADLLLNSLEEFDVQKLKDLDVL